MSAGTVGRREFIKTGAAIGGGLLVSLYSPLTGGPSSASAVAEKGFALNAFVRIAADNTVTVIAKHLEMGQGIWTGLPTIVAVVATVAALVGCGIVLRGRTLATSDLVAVLAPASLLLTPYARPHDQVILALSWASVIAATLAMRGGARRLALASLVAAAFVLPWALFLLSLVGLSPSAAVLGPLATGALVAWSVVRGSGNTITPHA